MAIGRREFFQQTAAMLPILAAAMPRARAAVKGTGIPGPYPGRVAAVEHPGCIVGGAYQAGPIRDMMHRGMTELTGAPGWVDAWRTLFEKGDVVGIKVSPVGGKNLCSDATVMHEILDEIG